MAIQEIKSDVNPLILDLVKGLIQLKVLIEEALKASKGVHDLEERARADLSILYARRHIEETVMEISK